LYQGSVTLQEAIVGNTLIKINELRELPYRTAMRQYSCYIPVYTSHQEQDFSRHIKRHQGIIYYVIRRYKFIRKHEIDDYYQEVVIYAWRRYHLFDRYKSSFSTWLFKIAEWAILHYYRKLRKDIDRVAYVDFSVTPIDVEEECYNEQLIQSLYKSLEVLTTEERSLTMMLLSGETGKEISAKLGRAPAFMERKLKVIKEKIRTNKDKYFEGIKIDPIVLQTSQLPRFGKATKLKKPVVMIDLDGNITKRFDNLNAVAAAGYSRKVVSNICNGIGHLHKGFRWRYEGETRLEILNRVVQTAAEGQRSKALSQYDQDGNFIRRFNSVREAIKAGYHVSNIKNFKKGQQRQCSGFLWELCD
jgi:RNA polymerase sigma factor (sigma-70 family)